jgi:tetratricopeptide (TPR) repeat protein
MADGWRLGPHRYVPVLPPSPLGPGRLVRRDGEGPRVLLRLWEPRPPAREFDALREAFLQACAQAEPVDPGRARLGFDDSQGWCLQELRGTPLTEAWARAGREGRGELRARVEAALAGARAPRLLVPEAIGIEPGRVRLPRAWPAGPDGAGSPGPEELFAALEWAAPEPAPGEGARPWAGAPDLDDGTRTALRGRSRELTYLKSLVLGFGTRKPMERVVLLQGEPGLGLDRLCDWTAAAAETEGLWVADLDAGPGATPGDLLGRILAELLAGLEAEFYAACPAAARALSRRLGAFAFLLGRRRTEPGPVLSGELAAALEAMAFAQARHPRLVVLRGLERTAPGAPALVRELVPEAAMPWLVAARDAGPRSGNGPGAGAEARACLAALGARPGTATVLLERLEDADLAESLGDRLGDHDLPEPFLAQLAAAALGSPGLLGRILERLQSEGALVQAGGRWTLAPGRATVLAGRDAPGADLLEARLGRLRPETLAAVRHLALAEEPLECALLGRALGLDGDAAEELLRPAVDARLVQLDGGIAQPASPRAAGLALARVAPGERAGMARALFKALEGEPGSPLLTVRLLALGLDRPAAMAEILAVLDEARCGPGEAERILQEALPLAADASQQARLWEFLGDAWAQGWDDTAGRPPWEPALEALDRAAEALAGMAPGPTAEDAAARLARKRGLLELRRRRPDAAAACLDQAAALLADHPFHPEQPRLRLARGRLLGARGAWEPALAAVEDGLALLAHKGPGADPADHAALLLDRGRILGERGRLREAAADLETVLRLAEQAGDPAVQVRALQALALVRMALGQVDAAAAAVTASDERAGSLDDPALAAEGRLVLGIHASLRQQLGAAQAALAGAAQAFVRASEPDRACLAQAWHARNLAALGAPERADLALAQAAGSGGATARELGERTFLEAEGAGFRGSWGEARRAYQAAANRFEHAGLAWRCRLARLRAVQAEALEAAGQGQVDLRSAWARLDQQAPAAEDAGGWLELEWQRARALLLEAAGVLGTAPAEALLAWGEVLAGARRLKLPAAALEAGTRSAVLLLGLGEPHGARARVQDAAAACFELAAALPPGTGLEVLGRKDLQSFLRAAEQTGLRFPWPPRAEGLPDWSLARAGMAPASSSRVEP